jgi:hypothetical protein
MMKRHFLKCLVGITIVALAPSFANAAPESGAPTASPEGVAIPAPAAKTHKKMKMKKPIKMREPMETGMAKPGMMKEDMHQGMMQKDSEMNDMMEKEEQDMK